MLSIFVPGGGQIGKNCRFYGPTSITIDSTSFPFISMGDNVVLTEDVIILAHDYSYEVFLLLSFQKEKGHRSGK